MSAETVSTVIVLARAACNASEIAAYLSLEPFDVLRIIRRARVW